MGEFGLHAAELFLGVQAVADVQYSDDAHSMAGQERWKGDGDEDVDRATVWCPYPGFSDQLPMAFVACREDAAKHIRGILPISAHGPDEFFRTLASEERNGLFVDLGDRDRVERALQHVRIAVEIEPKFGYAPRSGFFQYRQRAGVVDPPQSDGHLLEQPPIAFLAVLQF